MSAFTWNGKPRTTFMSNFPDFPEFPLAPSRLSSIARPKPPAPKGFRDPREANLLTYEMNNKAAKAELFRKIQEVPGRRFFDKNQHEDADPELLNLNFTRPPPFSHIRRPVPPPFPLSLFDASRMDDDASSAPSRLSIIPKLPSMINEFGEDDKYDAARLDAERKGGFLSRRTARTRINVEIIKQEKKKLVKPLAEQVRHWETHLRDKTSQEKFKTRTLQLKQAEKAEEARAREKHSRPNRVGPPPPKPIYAGDDNIIREMLQQSKKDELKAQKEMSTYFQLPAGLDVPKNSTITKTDDLALEMITPYNLYDIISRDKQRQHLLKQKTKRSTIPNMRNIRKPN